MVNIQAEQLFFSRVEAAFSPDSRSGYQVVYKTSGITDSDAKEIEKRVQCFKADVVEERYQYFHTSSNKVVLTCSALIQETDTRITDRSGRPGAFVAHCLVFDQNSFSLVGNNPFVIFNSRNHPFILEPESMIESQTKQEGPTRIEVEPIEGPDQDEFDFVQEWDEAQLSKLWLLGADVQKILKSNQSIMIRSEDEFAIQDVLKYLFSRIPPNIRLYCTFDTFIDNCVPKPGMYWALGGERRANNSRFIQVNLDRQSVDYNAPDARGPTDLDTSYYSRWLYDFLEKDSHLEASKHLSTIQTLSTAFEEGNPISVKNVDMLQTSVQSFILTHDDEIRNRLQKAISMTPIKKMSEDLLEIIWEEIHFDSSESQGSATHTVQYYLSVAAQQSISDLHEFASRAYNWILTKKLQVAHWRQILELARSAKHQRLELLASSQKPKKLSAKLKIRSYSRIKVYQQIINRLANDRDLFMEIADELAPTWIDPIQLISDETVHLMVEFLNTRSKIIEALTEKQQRDLLIKIIKYGGGTKLSPEKWNLSYLQSKSLKAVKVAAKKHKNVNSRFLYELNYRIRQAHQSSN